MADARKTLGQLREEWENCEKCELGIRRKSIDGEFVFGVGKRRGILFVGEGPGVNEEKKGIPFIGKSGQLLRKVITKLGLVDYYITNIVACRSCAQEYDGDGNPRTYTDRRTGEVLPKIKDEAPTPIQVEACSPRLHEEIYLVDPVIIIALGGEAAKGLTGRPVPIAKNRGNVEKIFIPGAWSVPVRTEKKKAWARSIKGEIHLPVARNLVEYLMLPTWHPSYVHRMISDERRDNPLQTFVEDIKKAAAIYDRYMLETYGTIPSERELEAGAIRSESDVYEDSTNN